MDLSSLTLDLGGVGAGGDFGGQAMSILNTLRNRGFAAMPVPSEEEEEESPGPTATSKESREGEEGKVDEPGTKKEEHQVDVKGEDRAQTQEEDGLPSPEESSDDDDEDHPLESQDFKADAINLDEDADKTIIVELTPSPSSSTPSLDDFPRRHRAGLEDDNDEL